MWLVIISFIVPSFAQHADQEVRVEANCGVRPTHEPLLLTAEETSSLLAKHHRYQADLPLCAVFTEMAVIEAYTGQFLEAHHFMPWYLQTGTIGATGVPIDRIGTALEVQDIGLQKIAVSRFLRRDYRPLKALRDWLDDNRAIIAVIRSDYLANANYAENSVHRRFLDNLSDRESAKFLHAVWITGLDLNSSNPSVYYNDSASTHAPSIIDWATFKKALSGTNRFLIVTTSPIPELTEGVRAKSAAAKEKRDLPWRDCRRKVIQRRHTLSADPVRYSRANKAYIQGKRSLFIADLESAQLLFEEVLTLLDDPSDSLYRSAQKELNGHILRRYKARSAYHRGKIKLQLGQHVSAQLLFKEVLSLTNPNNDLYIMAKTKLKGLGPLSIADSLGRVSITSWPHSHIYIDGTYIQDAPLWQYELPVGAHTIRLQSIEDGRQKLFTIEVNEENEARKIWHFESGSWLE
jgi:hypothetical protein